MRKLILLLMAVVILVGCAKAGNPVSTNEVLVLSDSVPLNGYARDVEVYEDYIVIAEDKAGLSLVNRSSGERIWITSVSIGEESKELVDINNVAYLSEFGILAYTESLEADQINIVDVSDFTNPAYMSTILGGVSGIYELRLEVAGPPEQGADSVALFYYSFASSGYLKKGGFGYFVGVEDNVLNLGFIPGNGQLNAQNDIYGYDEDEDYYYLASGQRGVKIMSKLSEDIGVIINSEFDVAGEALDAVIIGNYLYVACRQEGIKVFDVTDRNSPVIEPLYERSTSGLASDLAHEGNYLALASTSGGVYLFNVSDPSAPSYIEKDSSNSGYTYSVSIKDGYVFAGARDKLTIFEIK
ncbi:MAG: hypothetical protein P9L91_00335 [Candidatus Zophobacter franzmannii]|nr:hypothetical protein [Candidatus Zophobacter franzmannii]